MLYIGGISVGQKFAERSIIGAALGTQILGYYVFATQLIDNITELFENSLRVLILPVFAKLKNDANKLRSYLYNAIKATYIIGTPIAAGLIIIAPSLIPAVFGSNWSGSIIFIQLLAGISLVLRAFTLNGTIIMALGKPEKTVALSFLFAAVQLILTYILASQGIEIMLITQMIWAVAIVAISFSFLKKNIELELQPLIKSIAPAAASSLIMVATIYTLQHFMSLRVEFLIVASILCGPIVYITAILNMDRHALTIVKSIYGKRTTDSE
jgi:O-antigen/teichoic acid export membrane protein